MDQQPDPLTARIIGAAIAVHKALGPGLLESTYQECLCHELRHRGLSFRRQVPIPINYRGTALSVGYRLDVLVEETAILELKAAEELHAIHRFQLLTYLKHARKPVGLPIHFNVPLLKDGIE